MKTWGPAGPNILFWKSSTARLRNSWSVAKRCFEEWPVLALYSFFVVKQRALYFSSFSTRHFAHAVTCFYLKSNSPITETKAIYKSCPWHIQSVFNLIVDILVNIHVMVNWQLSKKGICWPVSPDCFVGSKVHLIGVTHFLKVISWPVVGFNWLLAQVHNRKDV